MNSYLALLILCSITPLTASAQSLDLVKAFDNFYQARAQGNADKAIKFVVEPLENKNVRKH